MGSASDHEQMLPAKEILNEFGIDTEYLVASAHRAPDVVVDLASTAKNKGFKAIIAGAGGAAHLPGVIAAHTTLPVIGIPIFTSSFNGMDSLLSIVQMPSGIPVATVAVGKSGGKNAGILAAQIIGTADEEISNKLSEYKKELKEKSLNQKLG